MQKKKVAHDFRYDPRTWILTEVYFCHASIARAQSDHWKTYKVSFVSCCVVLQDCSSTTHKTESVILLSNNASSEEWMCAKLIKVCAVSSFRRTAAENCALLRCYAAISGNFLPTLDSWTLRMGPLGCPETSVINYHYSLRNSPEERGSLIQCDAGLIREVIFKKKCGRKT